MYRERVGKREGRRPLERLERRWEDNIKMDLKEARYVGLGWIELDQDRESWQVLVNALRNLRVP